jgi:hypothetical protein
MNDQERQRRIFAAQGFAAIAFFVFAHGAHAAAPKAQPHAHATSHAAAFVQTRR